VPGAVRSIGTTTALAVVVSNMIGTGVFTSLGFQAANTHTGFALLMLWAVGGVVAWSGALAYAELGAALPRSGGEYIYLSRIYHPVVGFLAGWVSLTVGFAAPIALAGIAFGRYLGVLVPVPPLAGSLVVLAIAGLVQLTDIRLARGSQVALTAVNLLVIAGFVVSGLFAGAPEPLSFAPSAAGLHEVAAPAFAVSLIYVSYAFSGWNAAGYIAGEIADPERSIPRALAGGTALVTALYLLLNWTFLRTIPAALLPGTVEVGALSAARIFGPAGGRAMSGAIAALLVATVSAMVMAGSRLTQAMTADLPALRAFAAGSRGGVPRNAGLAQLALTLALLLTGSFERVMAYAGFMLNVVTTLTVAGLLVLRWREPLLARPFRAWGFPVTPLLFLLASLWTLGFVVVARPLESLAGFVTLVIGAVVHAAAHAASRTRRTP
jgi:APA family basic amino acid/polyamine antiporter